MRFLGEMNILTRIAHIRFVQNRIHRMRQRLINPAPGHDVAAEKKTHHERVSAKYQIGRARHSCARRALYRKRRAEDCAPYLSPDATSASQRDLHPIISDAHVHTALYCDVAELRENFALAASDDFRAAMSDNGAVNALFLAPRELCPNRRVTD